MKTILFWGARQTAQTLTKLHPLIILKVLFRQFKARKSNPDI